jgi:hypothetical protein
MKIALVIFLLLAVEAFAGWTEPVNMGPKINSDLLDRDPCISTDGKFFFLSRTGAGGLDDIYFSEMTDTGWTNARPMPTPINSNAIDEAPFFTRDGTRLYVASNRAGSMGWLDIWYVDYDTLTGEWGEPAVCDTPLNSTNSENVVSLTGDNIKAYLNRGGTLGPLTVATWNGQNWGNLTRLGSLIETGDEDDPDISADGNTIYFTRWLLHIGRQIFYSTKYDTCDNCWNEPIRLPEIINNPPAKDPFICHDGTKLYFVAERPSGFGSGDIYYSDYILDVHDAPVDLPVSLSLKAYPNPFNSTITISFYVPRTEGGNVELRLYDVTGRQVRNLFTSDDSGGHKRVVWDVKSGDKKEVGSGIYFCVLSCRGRILKSVKITLMK